MCLGCANLDNVKKRVKCDGKITPFMTLNQLVTDLQSDSVASGKTTYRIIKNALINPPLASHVTFDSLQVQFV